MAVEPRIWNHVRRAVDDRGQPGQFILAGSAAPADDATRHTGAGRFSRLRLRPMSLFEAALNGRVMHYRDSDDLEVDAIVEAGDGRWAAFEIKLGGEKLIDEGALSLKKFSKRIDTSKTGDPAALGVIVATGYGYVREDGIHVIPIGALGP